MLGSWELYAIVIVVLIIFGPKNLPKLFKSVGQGIREFRKAAKDVKSVIDEDDSVDEKKD